MIQISNRDIINLDHLKRSKLLYPDSFLGTLYIKLVKKSIPAKYDRKPAVTVVQDHLYFIALQGNNLDIISL